MKVHKAHSDAGWKMRSEPVTPKPEFRTAGAKDARIKKICADFEAIFIYQLLETMRSTIPQSTQANQQGQWKETCKVLFDQKVAEAMAGGGSGIGLQQIIYNQIQKYEKTEDLM
ncbi:MAG: rod-binding protein [Syntrophales bacterium]|jgi:flagellar protein FlgJ|nr:rod-binding protein [Syntrophales bacterium]MDY0043345.1 rod-binding protein [Syntrophales bacterium]